MKKFYSILLASAVALSAAAGTPAKMQASVERNATWAIAPGFNSAKYAKIESLKDIEVTPAETTISLKAPAKAAPTTMDELVDIYDYTMTVYTQTGNINTTGTARIAKGEGANDIEITGLYYIDVTLKGTVDFSKKTITLPSQLIIDMPENSNYPGKDMDMWLYGGMASETEWSDDPITITINSDGTLSSRDRFVYGPKGLPGATYAYFGNVKLGASDMNTTITTQEYDVVDGYFTNTTHEFVWYCKAEYKENYSFNGDVYEECVILDKFMYPLFDGESISVLPVDLYRGAENEAFIDPILYFTVTDEGETNYGAAVYWGNDEDVDAIEGTFHDNIIEWSVDWAIPAVSIVNNKQEIESLYGKYLGCKLELPFNVENPGAGISDVIADSDANAPVEFFNLQGARISNPAAGQLVIRRQGKTVTKVFVK